MRFARPFLLVVVAALLGWSMPARSAADDPAKPESPNAAGPAIRDETPPPPPGNGPPPSGEGPREGEGPRRPPRSEFGDPSRPAENGFRPDGSGRNEVGRPRGDGPRNDAPGRNDGDGPRPQPGFRSDGGPRNEFRGPPLVGPGVPMGHGQAGPGSGAGMMHGGMRMHGGHFDIERMKDEDPEMYALVKGDQDLERATFDLSNRYRQTMKAEDREKIKAELQAAVEKHFMVRQQKRELELKRLEEQLTRMKESVAKRLAEKGPIIEQRVKDLTGEQDSGF